MPFIRPERREPVRNFNLRYNEPGDLRFQEYEPLVIAWRKEPRWTTAHNEFKQMFGTDDRQTAKILAFLEFYIREVHRYENKKLAENGDI